MKILCTEVELWEKELLEKSFPQDTVYCVQDTLTPELIKKYADIDILSVFISSKITAGLLAQLPDLKLIMTRSTGFDHIDIQAASEQGIVVCNAPTYATTAVAEYTFALLLALARLIYTTCYQVKHKHAFEPKELRGFELKGKTIGIVGMGSIGKEVARIAHGFGMKIVVYDICKDEALEKQMHITYVSLPELLATSDIITLHVPLNRSTHHMINDDTIKDIKHGAFLINTARGALIDNKALLQALKNGVLAGAALDVLEDRQSATAKKLIDNPCVLVTPHNAYNTHESAQRLLNDTITTIKAWQADKPIHVVGPKEVCAM